MYIMLQVHGSTHFLCLPLIVRLFQPCPYEPTHIPLLHNLNQLQIEVLH